MTISLKHAFTSAKADGPDSTQVQPSNWNAEHTLTMATSRLVGRTTAGNGAAEEIAVGANLSLLGGTLNLASDITVTNATVGGMLLSNSDDRSGLLEINQLGSSTYSGIQAISGTTRWSFMGGASFGGFYDDSSNQWCLQAAPGGANKLFFAGNEKLATANGGVEITGTLATTGAATVAGTITAGGAITSSATFTGTGVRLTSITDASLTSTGHALQIGPTDGANLVIDNTEIIARNNSVASAMSLNATGGNVTLGATTSTIFHPGTSLFGTTNSDPGGANVATGAGVRLTDGGVSAANLDNVCAVFNRMGTDGTIVSLRGQGTAEGTISVSGTTVSYNGGHLSRWSRLIAGDTAQLLKGTVMSNLDMMIDWDGADNEQLNHTKVSDVEGDPNVAGVFVAWDTEDSFGDYYLAMTGDMVIRIAAGTTVQRGDLLMSAGDGTAKPQGDDIIRAKTIAKVISVHVSNIYEDGSYCVPCVLMAC
jgi:hypothetical protein